MTELKLIGYTREQKRWLYILLLGSGIIMLSPLYWINQEVQSSFGRGASEAVLTYHLVLLFFLITVGFSIALGVDLMIRHRVLIFGGTKPGKRAKRIRYLWGYGEVVDVIEEAQDLRPPVKDQLKIIKSRKTKRKGRTPTFPIERWIPIVEKWENRDPLHDIFSLEDLIGQYLGTNPDGSPILSKQSYYGWRDKVFEEYAKEDEKKDESQDIEFL
ncbi:MAG: hypothetical protein HN855_08015 [Anaerolineae bacterium]|nr:hypothetical protein [Anaerolineae bacterium]